MNLIYFLLAMAGIILILLFIALKLLGVSKYIHYKQDMIFLEEALNKWEINQRTYILLQALFDDIYRNDKNHQRTMYDWNLFRDKYASYFPEYEEKNL